ncbi:MAG: hypothetical protein K9M75_01300 [Phycisphaerae bacterium]|nr:hypothetical protein [Phycisphaerae bacterium]
MSLAVDTDRCMFFVGGNDFKSNSPSGVMLAGGCTKEWWDSQANIDTVAGKQAAMAKLMSSHGDPIATVLTTSHSLYDIGGTNYVKITDNNRAAFSNAEVGMLVYHPDGAYMLDGGAGVYKIREVGGSGDGNTYIVLDATWLFEGYPAGLDGDTVLVGGAWDELGDICTTYISAENYTQEIWVNKDIAPAYQWDWSNWSGEPRANTWLTVTGFHRVPGDITDPDGAYYQTVKDIFDNGVDSNCLVEVDLSAYGANGLISESNSYNIRMSGFNFCNGVDGCEMFSHVSGGFANLVFEHTFFELSCVWYVNNGSNLLFLDCCFEHSSAYVSDILLFPINAVDVVFMGCCFKNVDQFADVAYDGICHVHNCLFEIRSGAGNKFANIDTAGTLYSYNNTIIGFEGADGAFVNQGYDSIMVSVNDLIYNKVKTSPAYHVGFLGGTYIVKNPCVYSENGQLDDVMTVDPTSPFITQISEIPGLLEVDPLLDSDYEPLEEQVRTGGIPDILGDATAIGAIQTMNTTVINSAVQAALTSQGYTTGRAPYLDALSSGIKLSADGLDNVVVAEPTGDPSTWSFAKCLRWLIMRFMNKHTSDNFSGIVVHDVDGVVATSQAVTEVDGLKSVGKVTL